MRLTQLEYLMLIKKHGSISKAARAAFVSQPVLSTAIKDLENELGHTILLRSKRGVEFTDYGKSLMESVIMITQEIERIKTLSSDSPDRIQGRVHLGAGSYICNYIAGDVLMSRRGF